MADDHSHKEFNALEIPFSDEELYLAFRIGVSDADARSLVREIRESERTQRRELERYNRDPHHFVREGGFLPNESPAFGVSVSEDILIILSLLNDGLSKRVADYYRWVEGEPPSQHGWWEERREELRPMVRDRLTELDRDGPKP